MIEAAQPKARSYHTFNIPAKLAGETGVNSITVVELTADEELMATKRANNDPIRCAFEFAKQSLVAMNDSPLSLADGTADKAWHELHPKVRSLVMRAYSDTHNPAQDEGEAFLKTRAVTVR